jgi:hypothetical protein
VKIVMWTGWVSMALAIVAIWALPVTVTIALFRTSRRRDRASSHHG